MKKFRSLSYFACICLALVLIVSTLLTACSAPVSSPSASAPVTSTSASTAATQVFELKLSHHLPPSAPAAKALAEWSQKIEASTNGRVKITIYPSESLVKAADAYASTAGGVCDIAYVAVMYNSSKWSLNSIVNLSALPIPTDSRGYAIWAKLWEKYPAMLNEFAGVKLLGYSVCMPTSLHTTSAVKVPDDIKGMKIAAMGDSVKILQAAGAAPVSMGAGDWYLSVQKGVISGILAPIGVLTDRGIQEVVQNHVDLGMGQGGNTVMINQDRWNSFPADIQKAFTDLIPWLNDAITKANKDVEVEGWQKCAGQKIYRPTADEMKLWLALAGPASQDWIKANASKGPSQEMFDYTQQLIAQTK